MAAYYGFYQPLEQRLQVLALIPSGLDQSLRIKLPVLQADLAALGMDAAAIEALPVCQQLPQIDSRAAALGVSYVLEGRPSADRSCDAESRSSLAWMPPAALPFSMCMVNSPAAAGRISSNTWTTGTLANPRRSKSHAPPGRRLLILNTGWTANRYCYEPGKPGSLRRTAG
jgi:hypothetical protein